MSLSKKVKTLSNISSNKSAAGLWDRLFGKRKAQKLEKRRLALDPLEERVLLSLTVNSGGDMILNTSSEDIQVNTSWQDIRGDVDVATNDSGDIVVAWTAADKLTNGDEDLNIYARYLTDEVVLLTLPTELIPTGSQNVGGTFELIYNPAEVQRLSFYSAVDPAYGAKTSISGTIEIANYFEGSRIWKEFSYDESLNPDVNAANLQAVIRSMGKDYANIVVSAYSEYEFDITYYGFEGENVYELGVRNCSFTSGYQAGAVASTLTEASTVTLYNSKDVATGISVYRNAYTTADNIKKAFATISTDRLTAPTSRTWTYDPVTQLYQYATSGNAVTMTSEVEIEVAPVTYTDLTGKVVASQNQFYITFVGKSGLTDQQDMLVSSAKTKTGIQLIDSNYIYNNPTADPLLQTVKQSSPVFRVNSVEMPEYEIDSYDDAGNPIYATDEDGDKIATSSGKTDQYSPAITMDKDGNFIIVWESLTEDGDAEIYARRFTVQGIVSENLYGNIVGFYTDGGISLGTTSETYVPQYMEDPYLLVNETVQQVQGVRPLAEEFMVNVSSNGNQTSPDVACDGHGNFVVTWTTDAQWNSYYAGIFARWFDNTGLAVTGEIGVRTGGLGTPYYGESSVAMNADGYAVILYTYGNSLYFSVYGDITSTANAKLTWYNPVNNQLIASGAYGTSVDFDANGRYIIAYTLADSTINNTTPSRYSSVYYVALGIKYDEELGYITVDWNGNAVEDLGEQFDAENRHYVNGVSNTLYADLTAFDQGRVSVGVDADGDIFFAYQGFGDDVQVSPFYYANNVGRTIEQTQTVQMLTLTDFFENDLVYWKRQVLYGDVYSYENKNEDLLGTTEYLDSIYTTGRTDYDDPTLYTDGILYKALAYANSFTRSGTDVDTYIKACLVGAQINFKDITEDQLGRLNSLLEYVLGNLRGASNDILYSTWSSINGIQNNSGSSTGTVNNYRDGSNARYYFVTPNGSIDSGTVSMICEIGTSKRWFQVTAEADLVLYDDSTALYQNATAEAIRSALQTAIAEQFDGESNENLEGYSVSVRAVSNSELTDWEGTDYEIYLPTNTLGLFTPNYTVFEIVFQNSLHDTEVNLRMNYDASELTFDIEDYDGNYRYLYNFQRQSNGTYGKEQSNPAVAMSDSGDVTVVWTHDSTNTYGDTYVSVGTTTDVKSTQIFLRHITESTDTAGPQVTSVQLPDGTVVEDGDSVTSSIKNLVVTFTDDLYTTLEAANASSTNLKKTRALHSVDNIDNWKLLRDGVEITDTIDSIVFGLNASEFLAQNSTATSINTGTLALGSNSHEAVITLKDGSELTTGNYTLVVSSRVWDTDNNALGSNGINKEGDDYTLDFSIITLDTTLAFDTIDEPYFSWAVDETPVEYYETETGEKLISGIDATDNNITLESIIDGDQDTLNSPNSPNSVASDANGNFVAVWEVEGVGIYYHSYSQRYAFDNTGERVLVTTTIAKGLVTGSNALNSKGLVTAQQASVALDDRGYFVVVWDMEDATTGYRDVYAARYQLSGEISSMNGYYGSNLVNIETDRDQQNASVSIDSDGDFVIVWESYDQDYTNTWGIFGRRYSPNGYSFGTSNTQQKITIGGTVTNDTYFYQVVYAYTDRTGNRQTIRTGYIPLSATMATNRTSLESALLALTYTGKTYDQLPDGVANSSSRVFTSDDIKVTRSGEDSLLVEFKGDFANQTVELLQTSVYTKNTTGQYVSTGIVSVDVASVSEGSYGTEFIVNDTVTNHQRYASVDMDAEGNFVVTWTSWGQDDDAEYETNIYAKKFVSNHFLRADSSTEAVDVTVIGTEYIDSRDDIGNHEETSTTYEGVAAITSGDSIGSGVLLNSGLHILTAAHVVCETGTNIPLDVTGLQVQFYTAGGVFTYSGANGDISAVYVIDGYNGQASSGYDIAIIQLSVAASKMIPSYDIYRDSDELSQTFYRVGYGLYGNASDPEDVRDDWTTGYEDNGTKHAGYNTWDVTGSIVLTTANSGMLVYDLDDGTNANDYLGNNCGVRHLGVNGESGACPGDSGGPCFINGKIAGLTSGGYSSSEYGMVFGEFGYDTRVSYFADWIDSITSGNIGNEFLVNTNMSTATYYTAIANNTAITVDENMKGYQIWSDVAMDYDGNFVITWTSYGQDGHGDSNTGSTTNGLGGIYGRRYAYEFNTSITEDTTASTTTSAATNDYATTSPFLVCDYTDNDQIHSKVSCSADGDFVITWESFKDREKSAASDLPTSFGIYAKRYLNTTEYYTQLKNHNLARTDDDNTYNWDSLEGMSEFYIAGLGTFGIYGEYGTEFIVNQTLVDDQVGSAVTLNSNGDMIFVWTDMGAQTLAADGTVITGSEVKYRTVTLGTDTTPPTVTSADATFSKWQFIIDNQISGDGHWEQLVWTKVGDDWIQQWKRAEDITADDTPDKWSVSLIDNNYVFAYGESVDTLTFTFSEVMMTSFLANDLTSINRVDYIKLIGKVINPATGQFYSADEAEKAYHDAILEVLNESHDTADGYDNALKRSILNAGNWTLMRDGIACFSSLVDDLYYVFNENTGNYELKVNFIKDGTGKSVLAKGNYVLTLSDAVTDLFKNNLDGDYDGNAGGSFSLRFTIEGTDDVSGDEDPKEAPVFSNSTYSHDNSDVVTYTSNGTQSFIVVATAERIIEYDEDTAAEFPNAPIVRTVVGNELQEYLVLTSISCRKYTETSDGLLVGEPEKIIDTVSDPGQINPCVAAEIIPVTDANGNVTYEGSDNYLVAWTGVGETASQGVYARACFGGVLGEGIYMINSGYRACYDVRAVIVGNYALFVWREASSDSNATGVKLMARWVNFTKELTANDKSSEPFILASEGNISIDYFDLATDYNGNCVVTWAAQNSGTGTSEIYAKVFSKSGSSYYTSLVDNFRVNTITTNVQDFPSVSMDVKGNYYIVWESSSTGYYNIYGRAFNYSNGKNTSKSWLGSTSDVRINVSNSTSNLTPDVSVSTGDNLSCGENIIVTWSAHNQEGTNYSKAYRRNLQDYGILARAFYGDTGLANNNIFTTSTGGEFLVNTVDTNGNQVRPSVSATGNMIGGKYPFVVTWTTPNQIWANVTDTPDAETFGVTVTFNEDDFDLLAGLNEVYYMYYPTSMMGTSISTDAVQIATTTTSSSLKRFCLGSAQEIGTLTGYYKPQIVAAVQAAPQTVSKSVTEEEEEIATVLTVNGYNIKLQALGNGWTVTVDGTTSKVASTITAIEVNQLVAADKESSIVVLAGNNKENFRYDVARNTASIMTDDMKISLFNVLNLTVDGTSDSDSATLVLSNEVNRVDLGFDWLTFLGATGSTLNLNNFENVLISSASKKNVINIKGSEDEDNFIVGNNYALYSDGYYNSNKEFVYNWQHRVEGTATVKISGNLEDSVSAVEAVSLVALPSSIIVSTSNIDATFTGFNRVKVAGATTASARIFGSTGTDVVSGTPAELAYKYDGRTELFLTNFTNVDITANGGNDTANLGILKTAFGSTFVGKYNESILTSGKYSVIMRNFAKINVDASATKDNTNSTSVAVLYDTLLDDSVLADGQSVALMSGSRELFTLLAFDQVSLKKGAYRGNDTVSASDAAITNLLIDDDDWWTSLLNN